MKKVNCVAIGNENVDLRFYPEGELVVIQIDKKKTRDKLALTKDEWLDLSMMILKECFGEIENP